jgi:D-alanine-D-alanine ligase-like ATP-grasp enzyme
LYVVGNTRSTIKVLILGKLSEAKNATGAEKSRHARFAETLRDAGFAAESEDVKTIVHLKEILEKHKPNIVFSGPDHLPAGEGIDFPQGKAINVHTFLESLGIPYVGSSPRAIESALAKADTKDIWTEKGIATPPYIKLESGEEQAGLESVRLPHFPLIVKPEAEGNSRGISESSVVFDREGLERVIESLSRGFGGGILVEHYLGVAKDFREITCASIGNGADALMMPAEIVFSSPKKLPVVTNGDKDRDRTMAVRIEDPVFREKVENFAREAFRAADVRDYSRCDIVFAEGELWALEVNGQPMVPDPWFGSCCSHVGLSEEQYLVGIIAAGMMRSAMGGLTPMVEILRGSALEFLVPKSVRIDSGSGDTGRR